MPTTASPAAQKRPAVNPDSEDESAHSLEGRRKRVRWNQENDEEEESPEELETEEFVPGKVGFQYFVMSIAHLSPPRCRFVWPSIAKRMLLILS